MSEHYGEGFTQPPASTSTSANDSIADSLAGTDASNLFTVIDRDNVHGLNLSVPEDAREVIKPWNERESTEKYAESGVDDQMVIHVPFTENVRVRAILLKLGRGDVAPRHLRIYANRPHIVDFVEAEETSPQLNISLLEGETAVTEYPLRAAAFANVHSLSLHFDDSAGEEVSRIYYVGFKGDTKTFKQAATSKLEIPAANAADAPLTGKMSERVASQQSTAR